MKLSSLMSILLRAFLTKEGGVRGAAGPLVWGIGPGNWPRFFWGISVNAMGTFEIPDLST